MNTVLLLAGTAAAFTASPAAVGRQRLLRRSSAGELDEVWLLPADAGKSGSMGEALQFGEVVCVLPVATAGEMMCLEQLAVAAFEKLSGGDDWPRARMPVADTKSFSVDVVMQCEEILLRVLDWVDDNTDVYSSLFRPSEEWASRQPETVVQHSNPLPPELYLADCYSSLRELYMAGELEWSEGEPAINVYKRDGQFSAHQDHLALTVLIPLSSPDDFEGGGTGFWPPYLRRGDPMADEHPQTPHTILKPPRGSALIFGGDVPHAAMPVTDGLRSVFVCSFSTRTPSSREDRCNGLQVAAANAQTSFSSF